MVRQSILIAAVLLLTATANAETWRSTKNNADDVIYEGRDRTFYCGCKYQSDQDNDGSGKIIDVDSCYTVAAKHKKRSLRVEWEHIVPASLMPVRKWDCWNGPGGSRQKCEKDPQANEMIFDLHNLAPSVGQINALRSDDRYADLSDETSDFGSCLIEDGDGQFEPPMCKRGDVARVWFYMRDRYGLEITPDEMAMFTAWSEADPVSPWESEREKRVHALTGISNKFVSGIEPDDAGSCEWE